MGFNVVFSRFPGGKRKAFTMSYDDGMKSDVRFIEIMRKSGLKCTFNLNSGAYPTPQLEESERRISKAKATELYRGDDIEVACHGVYHDNPTRLPDDKLTYEFLTDRLELEKQFSKIVKGCAYAFGVFDGRVVDTLKKCGIKYARTTMSTRGFGLPSNWLTLNPTCHHNDPSLMQLADRFINMNVTRDSQMFYLWGHTYEFDDNNNWEVFEKFAPHIGGHEDIWYATNMEICEYMEAFKRLEFTLDESMVYNPNAVPIWFTAGEDGSDYVINPGETLQIEWNR